MRKAPVQIVAGVGMAVSLLWILVAASAAPPPPTTPPTTRAANTRPTTGPADVGPDAVVLDALVDQYEPVPFDHRTHAVMAEMWDGCVTCHHRRPDPATRPAAFNGNGGDPAATPGEAMSRHPNGRHLTQGEAGAIPACKSCHPASADDPTVEMPNLKGAYHRQCLNCHKEWTGDNACGACHERRDGKRDVVAAHVPSKDDIVGRMHPPIPEPLVVNYKTRFTPAVGEHVVFRHKEHTGAYGLRCAGCHHRDNCSSCHDPKAGAKPAAPMKPGRTWKDSHAPCTGCHARDRCGHCHYKEGEPVPPPFEHARTVQLLDEDHARLDCFACHTTLKSRENVTCGVAAACHPKNPAITFPAHRPGPVNPNPTTRPSRARGPQKGIMR